MGLIMKHGYVNRPKYRTVSSFMVRKLVSDFIYERRHIYIEPAMGTEWNVCVDWEHETFLDNTIAGVTENIVSGVIVVGATDAPKEQS